MAKPIFRKPQLNTTTDRIYSLRRAHWCSSFCDMSSSLHATRREGPDPPPMHPTLAMSHPELGSLGGEIIERIIDIADEGKQRSCDSIVSMLLELFNKLLDFVDDALSTHGLSDNVAFWVEQTYKTIRRLERKVASLPASPAPCAVTAAATPVRTWASVAARPAPPSQEETALGRRSTRAYSTLDYCEQYNT